MVESKSVATVLVACMFGIVLLHAFGIAPSSMLSDSAVDNDYYDGPGDDLVGEYNRVVGDIPNDTQSEDSSDSSPHYSKSKKTSNDYESSDSGGSYVGSTNSDKFHSPSCGHAHRIKSGNMITFSSRQEAISAGYSPCKSCSP